MKHFDFCDHKLNLNLFFSPFSYSYYAFSSHIPYPKNGLNDGVWLMNLEYMRNQDWNAKMLIIYEEMQSHMIFCDQVGNLF